MTSHKPKIHREALSHKFYYIVEDQIGSCDLMDEILCDDLGNMTDLVHGATRSILIEYAF